MKSSELDYDLPPELIAQHPAARRDDVAAARLRSRARRVPGTGDSPISPGRSATRSSSSTTRASCRRGSRSSGRTGEVLLLEALGDGVWEALARPTRRLRAGRRYGPVELLEHLGEGRWRVRLDGEPAGASAAAAVHHRAARRSRALPDGLRARGGLGGGADGGAPLHAGAPRPAGRRAGDAARRARHVPPARRRRPRRAPAARRALLGVERPRGSGSRRRDARARGRDDDGARARDARPRRRRSRAAPISSSRPGSSSAAWTRC